MDVKRVTGDYGDKWIVAGEMDKGSALMLESMLLNSQIKGEEVVVDLSGLIGISSEGVKSFYHICSGLRERGGNLKLIGARGEVANCIRLLGLVDDSLTEK
jgi:anti-anti-sigma factor